MGSYNGWRSAPARSSPISKNKERDRSRPSLQVPACTRDHVRSDLLQSGTIHNERLLLPILILINRARRCVHKCHPDFYAVALDVISQRVCMCVIDVEIFLQIFLHKLDRRLRVWVRQGREDASVVILNLLLNVSNFLNPRVTERERGNWHRMELGREKWNDERRWNANFTPFSVRVSCHLCPPPSASLNFTSRAIHHSLACSIVRSKIMRHYYQQSHLFFIFFWR